MSFWAFFLWAAVVFAAGMAFGALLMAAHVTRRQIKWIRELQNTPPAPITLDMSDCKRISAEAFKLWEQEHHPEHDPGLKP